MDPGFGYHAQSPNDIGNPLSPWDSKLFQLELKSLSPLSPECCIYRVPERLRVVNEKAYTPQVVSIGPLHHGKERLKPMEEHKKRYLRDFLNRTGAEVEYYRNIIKGEEERLRNCYAEPIEFSSDEFVKIVLVDAAFIIEVLLRQSHEGTFPELQDEHDRIYKKPWTIRYIRPDMLLLENQLPLFILEDLYGKLTENLESSRERSSIIMLSAGFIQEHLLVRGQEDDFRRFSEQSSEDRRCLHFVDFLREFYVRLEQYSVLGRAETLNIPPITKLRQSGVQFQRSGRNLLEIHFYRGILEIPTLTIDDFTELTIRNLVAFEQCHCERKFMAAYIAIMDNLVNTPKDVELLVECGIVKNDLGNCSQVSTLINKLGDGVQWHKTQFYYAGIFGKLNEYSKARCPQWMAALRQNYFDRPWAIVSLTGAALIISLTFIQTVCSIITVKDSPPH